MRKWEYKLGIFRIPSGNEHLPGGGIADSMNDLGANGWELAFIVPVASGSSQDLYMFYRRGYIIEVAARSTEEPPTISPV